VKAPAGASVGLPRKASDLTVSMAGGPPVALSHYKGKPLLLAFILTTCPHCQHTIQLLSKLQPEYAPRGLQVLASALDQGGVTAVPVFTKFYHPPFPVGFSPDQDFVLTFCGYDHNHLPYMPILLFIDRQGMIREQHMGSDEIYFGDREEQNLRDSIAALVGPAAKPAARKATARKAATAPGAAGKTR
jgi:thiol-disulfide isomerase/thioredoxin